MSEEKPFYISQNKGFIEAQAKDELLHPEQNAKISADTLAETQYFGFCIPEARIHAWCYLTHRPNIKVVSGGPFVWQGHTTTLAHGLLCDYRMFMRDTPLANDLHDYRLANGYGVKVIEPLKRHHMTYEDTKRQQSIDLHFEAISPAVMFGDGNHFEQILKVRGDVVLRGKAYKVDGYTVRDRSWGKPRPEENLELPPMVWSQGVFNDDFGFSCMTFDQASSQPELAGTKLAMSDEKALSSGWIYRDGKVGRVMRVKKRVVRSPLTRAAIAAELEMVDEFDRKVHVRGQSIASNTFIPWGNIYAPVALMRWECEGLIAHGDYQEGIWNDFLNL